jgi:hypothetical protein
MQTINAKPYRRSNHIADQTISQIKPYRRSNHIADQTISQIKPYRRSGHYHYDPTYSRMCRKVLDEPCFQS